MKTNVALIGFMGTGKTAVGQVLAKELNMSFLEMDALISSKAGRPIPEIFEEDGEIGFREIEIEIAKRVAAEQHAVIACGGGVVLNWINIERLRESSVVVLLTASPSETLKRVSKEVGQRPLLEGDDSLTRIRQMLRFRQPFYARAADISVNTSRRSIAGVTEAIVAELRRDASFDWPQ